MIVHSRDIRPVQQLIVGTPADQPGDDDLQFHLTYEGLLQSATRGVADHKHEIRKKFHRQLKRFWDYHPFFRDAPPWVYRPSRPNALVNGKFPNSREDQLAAMNTKFGHKFVPLACADLCVYCSLDILFLRPDPPGAVWSSGDMDNRIKVLVDALQMPQFAHELGKYQKPATDEDPFFVLLENDRLITRLNVETDMLLEPTGKNPRKQDSRIIITVGLMPYQTISGNLGV